MKFLARPSYYVVPRPAPRPAPAQPHAKSLQRFLHVVNVEIEREARTSRPDAGRRPAVVRPHYRYYLVRT